MDFHSNEILRVEVFFCEVGKDKNNVIFVKVC